MSVTERKELTLSGHLLWDIDSRNIDYDRHSTFIIKRTLQYGFYSDWKNILQYYGLNKIIDVALKIRDLDFKTASFLSIVSGVSKNNFRCYTTKQSIPRHWDF